MTRQEQNLIAAVRALPSTRKPTRWDDVTAVIRQDQVPAGLVEMAAVVVTPSLDLVEPTPVVFTIRPGDGNRYLVNTEGYDYVRYAARVWEAKR